MPVAGASLMRQYKGKRIHVTVLDGGFEYEGTRYASLNADSRDRSPKRKAPAQSEWFRGCFALVRATDHTLVRRSSPGCCPAIPVDLRSAEPGGVASSRVISFVSSSDTDLPLTKSTGEGGLDRSGMSGRCGAPGRVSTDSSRSPSGCVGATTTSSLACFFVCGVYTVGLPGVNPGLEGLVMMDGSAGACRRALGALLNLHLHQLVATMRPHCARRHRGFQPCASHELAKCFGFIAGSNALPWCALNSVA